MLIACKCLNITLKSTANNLPSTLSIASQLSNYDEISYKTAITTSTTSTAAAAAPTTTTPSSNANQVHTVSSSSIDDNHDEQPPYIQCTTTEKLNSHQLQFFRTAKLSAASLIAPAIQHMNLINVTLIDNWNLHTCRYCKTITHAQANDSAKTLINPSLWTNQEKINIIKAQKHFSKSFNILLSPKSMDVDNTMVDATDAKSMAGGGYDVTTDNNDQMKQLCQHLKHVIESETEATDDRIERYTKQQRASLKAFCEKAQQDYHDILRTIANDAATETSSNDATLTAANLSATSKLLSDLTPPVTPDSTPMSIGNSPNFKQQPQSFLLLNQNVITKKHGTRIKHHSTPDKGSQRNFNADDDIFFDMDGLDTRDSNMPQITQSDDEDGDDDEDFEDAYVSRNNGIKITPTARKSGSKMFVAQSLPMAVPIFNQRNDDDYEEYPNRQDNVDIAASIKALAQSVHGEAIFGDLPKPRFSTEI